MVDGEEDEERYFQRLRENMYKNVLSFHSISSCGACKDSSYLKKILVGALESQFKPLTHTQRYHYAAEYWKIDLGGRNFLKGFFLS